MPMLITLALGLVAAGAVTRVLMKIAAARRASVMIDHPDSDRVDDQRRPSGTTIKSTDLSMNRKRMSQSYRP